MRVFVYYNLHKKLWSIRDCKTRRVIGHNDIVALANVKPKVSQAGRERVLREGRKNVHAGLEGTLIDLNHLGDMVDITAFIGKDDKITYNPYKYTGFVYKRDETAYSGSSNALLINRSVYA